MTFTRSWPVVDFPTLDIPIGQMTISLRVRHIGIPLSCSWIQFCRFAMRLCLRATISVIRNLMLALISQLMVLWCTKMMLPCL